MAVNKVTMNTSNGEEVLVDLTNDTVTPDALAEGVTAHDASGAVIVGTATPVTLVQTTGDSKTAVMSQKAVNNALKGISLGIASDGLIYLFVDGKPVGTGIAQGGSGDVFGYVDENNTIVLSGALADGTYTVKYEMEDGSVLEIGKMVLGEEEVYYSVSNTLTNCTSNNSAKTVAEGGSYSATITAKSGYELSSVKVTMGGTDITSSAVSGGNISIASVTGNIVITAVATEVVVEPTYTNKIPVSTDASGNLFNGGQGWKTGYRISGSSGNESAQTGTEVTGFIPVKYGDTVYLKGIKDDGSHIIGFYSATYATHKTGTFNTLCGGAVTGEVVSFKVDDKKVDLDEATVAFMRVSATEITADSIITVNEPLE